MALLVFACYALLLLAALPAGAAPAWLAPVQLSVTGQSAKDPQVAVDARGDAVVLWVSVDNGVQASFRPLGGVWQAPAVLSQGVGEVERVDVATNPKGNAITGIWGRSNTVEVAEGSAENLGWQVPVTLLTGGWRTVNPRVTVNAQGDAVAVWEEWMEDGRKLVQAAYRSAAGGAWQAPVPVSGAWSLYFAEGHPGVALDAQGDAIAVWVRQHGWQTTVEAAVRPAASGVWQAPVPVSGLGQYRGTQVAVDAQGDAVAIWESHTQDNFFVEAAVRPQASGSWQAPTRLPTAGLGGVRSDLALNAQGNALVVWEGATANQRTVEVSAGSAANGVWGAPVRLATWNRKTTEQPFPLVRVPDYYFPPTVSPQVALNASGDAVAVWEHSIGNHNGVVQAAREPAGNSVWQTPVDIAAASTESLRVALDEQGEAVAAWGGFFEGAVEASALAKLAITRANLSNMHFRVTRHRRAGASRAPLGTRFHFVLSEAAELKITITRSAPCRVLPRLDLLHAGHRVCPLTLGTLRRSREPEGFNSVSFNGRFGRRVLSPGTYWATLTASNASALSSPVTLTFRVVR